MWDKVKRITSGVARAFTGGQLARPEDQNEEGINENFRKNEGENEERLRNWSYLAHPGVKSWLRPSESPHWFHIDQFFFSNHCSDSLVVSIFDSFFNGAALSGLVISHL